MAIVRIVDDYRFLRFDQLIVWPSVSEDSMNVYLHGWNDEYPTGFHSNYLRIPKYAARVEGGEQA